MKRLLFIPMFASLLAASDVGAAASPSTAPALQRVEVPRGFHQALTENLSAVQWAQENDLSTLNVQYVHMVRAIAVEYSRSTSRGLWEIWSLIRRFRGVADAPGGLKYELAVQRTDRGWPHYKDVVSPDGKAFIDAYECSCDDHDQYRVYLWQYKQAYVVGTELNYLSGPIDMSATLRQLSYYENLVLGRIY